MLISIAKLRTVARLVMFEFLSKRRFFAAVLRNIVAVWLYS